MGKYNRYTVYMDDCAAIIIEIDKGCDRPNNMSDDEIIDVYMENNYCGRNYEVEEGDPDTVFLDEEDIWGLVEEWWNKSEFLWDGGERMELVKVLSDEELKVIQRSDDKEVVGEIIGFKDFTAIGDTAARIYNPILNGLYRTEFGGCYVHYVVVSIMDVVGGKLAFCYSMY